MQILYHFINKIHDETARKSCGGVGCRLFLKILMEYFHQRPQDSENIIKSYREMQILYEFVKKTHHETTRFSFGGGGGPQIFEINHKTK